MNNATKETTPFIIYKSNVAAEAGITIAQLDAHHSRLGFAYDAGEPVWMIAAEMAIRATAPRKHKTPRQMALSVTRVERRI